MLCEGVVKFLFSNVLVDKEQGFRFPRRAAHFKVPSRRATHADETVGCVSDFNLPGGRASASGGSVSASATAAAAVASPATPSAARQAAAAIAARQAAATIKPRAYFTIVVADVASECLKWNVYEQSAPCDCPWDAQDRDRVHRKVLHLQ